MLKRIFKYLAVGVLLSNASLSHAQDFNPIEGTAITTEQVDVRWYSSAPEQWLRAFDDDSGVKFYDSGRMSERFGELDFVLPSGISNLKLTFYEKISGSWISRDRLYRVVLGSAEGDELCPPEYLDQLRSVEIYQQPLSDANGGVVSISKEVETLSYTRYSTDICTIEWSYSPDNPDADRVRHIFRQAISPDGGAGVYNAFSAFVFDRGVYRQIEIEYVGGSDGDGGTPYSPGKFFIPVTSQQWETCGIIAGCDFDDY